MAINWLDLQSSCGRLRQFGLHTKSSPEQQRGIYNIYYIYIQYILCNQYIIYIIYDGLSQTPSNAYNTKRVADQYFCIKQPDTDKLKITNYQLNYQFGKHRGRCRHW